MIKDLQASLQKTYYQLMPVGGIIRTAPKEIRDLDIGFYGGGFPNVSIECAIQQLNKLMMHYGCPSGIGIKVQVSMDLFLIELGRAHQPFDESFQQYQSWVTPSWVKSIWKKADHYGYNVVVLNNIDNPFPRVGDKWLMRVFEDLQFSSQELRQLNRVRLHQQVLFLSDTYFVSGGLRLIQSTRKDYVGRMKHGPSSTFPQRNLRLKILRSGNQHYLN